MRATRCYFSTLVWSLLHAPAILVLFAPAINTQIVAAAPALRPFLLGAFVVEALFLALLAFLATLPFAILPRLYRYIAPAWFGLMTFVAFVDARLHHALGFHINRFFLEVAFQPNAQREVGLSARWLSVCLAVGVAGIATDAIVGSLFIRRFASHRRPALWVVTLLALEATSVVGLAVLAFFQGETVLAAGDVLPLQPPLRMNRFLGRLTNREVIDERPRATSGKAPGGLLPEEVHLERKPDILLVLIESLRADFFEASTMPLLVRRSATGAVFEDHYASASSTHFSLFSLFFGLRSDRYNQTIGSGRSPLLFSALARHGYQCRLIVASSVNWMGLKTSVFSDVKKDLVTDLPGEGYERDLEMLSQARQFVETASEAPIFLVLFFGGTHFGYSFREESAVFKPYWDGATGGGDAAGVEPELVRQRARNAAHQVDDSVESFLQFFTALRRRQPLVIVTGDHGEEFREHGRFGHASDVTREQTHVPMMLVDESVAPQRSTVPTSHADVVPTLLALLGDKHQPSLYSDGVSMLEAQGDRYVLTTVGWQPLFALTGARLKVRFYGQDLGMGPLRLTDPADHPLNDPEALFRQEAGRLVKSFRGDSQ